MHVCVEPCRTSPCCLYDPTVPAMLQLPLGRVRVMKFGVWCWEEAQQPVWMLMAQRITPQLKEDHQKALLRREFELQSLNLQRRLEQKFWSQEKNLLVQESQQFRQSFLLLFMKLKWFLKCWRQGKIVHSEGDDFLEVPWAGEIGHSAVRSPWLGSSATCPRHLLQVNSMKELYMLLEEEELTPQQQADNRTCSGDAWTPNTVSGVGRIGPHWVSLLGGRGVPCPAGVPRL